MAYALWRVLGKDFDRRNRYDLFTIKLLCLLGLAAVSVIRFFRLFRPYDLNGSVFLVFGSPFAAYGLLFRFKDA